MSDIRGCTRSAKKIPYEKAVVYMKLLADIQKRESDLGVMADKYGKYLGSLFW